MREIKFRAWEKNMGEIIAVDDIYFETKMINIQSAWRQFDEIELMQYTGLKDKNGVEIYEGDIVHAIDVMEHATLDYQSVVEWIGNGWYVTEPNNCHTPLDLFDGDPTCISDATEIEIIGNIYENPDLLREQTSGSNEQKEERANQP